jgi:hypothetical protein
LNNPFNFSLVLIRLFGIGCIVLAALGFCFITAVVVLFFIDDKAILTEQLWPYAVQSFIGSPIWLLGGIIVIKLSPKLARFAAKGSNEA